MPSSFFYYFDVSYLYDLDFYLNFTDLQISLFHIYFNEFYAFNLNIDKNIFVSNQYNETFFSTVSE